MQRKVFWLVVIALEIAAFWLPFCIALRLMRDPKPDAVVESHPNVAKNSPLGWGTRPCRCQKRTSGAEAQT
ncbi:MAG: hypothetical protein DMG81_12705 [Acidobacteria bacterium]|nr:MAG: hypothetical protein DMG81_12705 [Acidobacteriota bacterium]